MNLRTYICILAGVVAALSTVIRISDYFTLSFDSWVYWELAISLTESFRYVDVTESVITPWPPLYPMLIAVWGQFFGLSLIAIKALNVVLSFAAAYVWMHVFYEIDSENKRSGTVLAFIIVSMWVPSNYYGLLSETLWVPLVGLTILLFLRLRTRLQTPSSATRKLKLVNWIYPTLAFALAILCRNISLALVVPLALLVSRMSPGYVIHKLSILIVPVLIWLATRTFLGQHSSHTLDGSFLTGLPHFREWVLISGGLFAPKLFALDFMALGLLVVVGFCASKYISTAVLHRTKDSSNEIAVLLIYAGLLYWGGATLLLLASSVPPIHERFYTIVIPLITFGSITILLKSGFGQVFKIACLALLVLAALTFTYRNMYFVSNSIAGSESVFENKFMISREWVSDTNKLIDQRVLAGEPLCQAIKGLGFSANTYRRWNNLSLGKVVETDCPTVSSRQTESENR